MLLLTSALFLASSAALASEPGADPSTWTPPPMVNVPEEAVPRSPATPAPAGPAAETPPPPGTGAASPFAPAPLGPPPGPEIGLMLTETLFGILTAGGVALLPYFVLLKSGQIPQQIEGLFLVLTFASVPLAVSQTELSIASGSRYYDVESWPAQLGGLVMQALVLGAFFYAQQQPGTDAGMNEILLLTGTVVGVPVAEMAMINIFKFPRRSGPPAPALLSAGPDGVRLGLPAPQPFASTAGGKTGLGLRLSLLSASF
jgi:hypothetical protein